MFKKNSIDSLDQETLFTINKFFENNLNVSETSRKLFVHRNTLVYRLEKIKKLTGLDLRRVRPRHHLQGGADGAQVPHFPGDPVKNMSRGAASAAPLLYARPGFYGKCFPFLGRNIREI